MQSQAIPAHTKYYLVLLAGTLAWNEGGARNKIHISVFAKVEACNSAFWEVSLVTLLTRLVQVITKTNHISFTSRLSEPAAIAS